MKRALPPIGAHVSAAGGAARLLDRVADLGVEAVQIYPSPPQNFRRNAWPDDERAVVKQTLTERQIPLFFHSIYLINLANDDERLWHASLAAVAHYLKIAPQFGAVGTVTHVGSHKGRGLAAVRARLEQAAAKLAVATSAPRGRFIIQNTAGGGGTLGRDLDELTTLYKIFAAHLDTAICLDTCHLFAAGLDITDPAVVAAWLDDFDRRFGVDKLALMHLNDSQFAAGSRRDRHANLGAGEIGIDALQQLVNEPRLRRIPFILEVPGTGAGPDADNIALAKNWRR